MEWKKESGTYRIYKKDTYISLFVTKTTARKILLFCHIFKVQLYEFFLIYISIHTIYYT